MYENGISGPQANDICATGRKGKEKNFECNGSTIQRRLRSGTSIQQGSECANEGIVNRMGDETLHSQWNEVAAEECTPSLSDANTWRSAYRK